LKWICWQQQQQHILTTTAPLTNGFAIIVDWHPSPSPYLVHMLQMLKSTKKNLDFVQPNVVYLPKTMNLILKKLLHNPKLFNLHSKAIAVQSLALITPA
jgi:hypothetical protein